MDSDHWLVVWTKIIFSLLIAFFILMICLAIPMVTIFLLWSVNPVAGMVSGVLLTVFICQWQGQLGG